METYSVEELATYLRTARDVMTTGNYAAIMLISYAGLRAREATALRWSDVDFDRMVIMVKRTAIEVKGGYSFSNTKGKKVRVVTISKHVAEELRRIRVEQRYDSLRMGWRNEEDLDLSRCVRCLPVAFWSSKTTHRDDQSRRTPEDHPARIAAYACFTLDGDGRPCQGHPGTTRSCGCDVDDGHVRSRIAHFTIGHGDAIRTAFKTQKNRSTERFVRKFPIFTPSVQWDFGKG